MNSINYKNSHILSACRNSLMKGMNWTGVKGLNVLMKNLLEMETK